jgi:AcrR family transcriptional regulator
MPRDASRTRDALVRAAEQRFALDGVTGARMRDIVRDAGQANDSAVGYHFGSREGLLRAIVERHLATMEEVRARAADQIADADVTTLVRLVVEPTAALLRTAEGRDFLRITEQLAAYAGVRSGRPALVIRGTVLAAQLGALEDRLAGRLPRPVARERVAALVTFLTASLAERARGVASGRRQALGHGRYVDQLVTMLTGALDA